MNKDNFETLLSDLYAIYNSSKVKDIPSLLDKYNGQEFDAVKTIFIRYNFRGHPNYDAELGTDKHVKFLIERYSDNDRILQKQGMVKPSAEEVITKKIEEAGEKVQEDTAKAKEETEKFVSQKAKELEDYFEIKKTEIDSKLKIIENLIAEKMSELGELSRQARPIIQQEAPPLEEKQKIEIKLELDFDDAEFSLPKELKEMGTGSRILLYDSKKQPKGLEIKDVLYDCVSEEGKCIKTMTINKI